MVIKKKKNPTDVIFQMEKLLNFKYIREKEILSLACYHFGGET